MENNIPISTGGKIILTVVKEELFPSIENLKSILVKVQSHRVNFFSNKELKKLYELEGEYSKISSDFFSVATKLQTPDILFKDLPEKPQHMIDYFNFQNAFQKNIDQGISYIEIIDRTLDRKIQRIDNVAAFLVSILAILISIILK